MIIKILLIAGALAFGVVVLQDRTPGQHLLLRRVAGVAVAGLGIVAIMWPQTTTYVANAIGVGRGTDLVLYVLVMVFVFTSVATNQRIHHLEHKINRLVRELAIVTATTPDDNADRSETA